MELSSKTETYLFFVFIHFVVVVVDVRVLFSYARRR